MNDIYEEQRQEEERQKEAERVCREPNDIDTI
jgi:hypothetical protein